MKKKSGAAQRLVSLVLALGLIFTLAPASAFAGDEAPASSAVMAAVDEEPVADGTEPVVDDSEPAVDDSAPVVDGTEPAEEPAVEGTEPAEEGTEPAVEGTEPTEEEVPAQQAALVAASVPAVMSGAPQSRALGTSFTFDSNSSNGVELWYATWVFLEGTSELEQLEIGNSTKFLVSPTSVICFFIKVPAGYELDLDNCNVTSSGNNIYELPLTDGYGVGHFDNLQQEAINKGFTHGFSFGGVDDLKNTVITLKTKPITNIYTVDKSQDFESTGVDIVEELPVEVKEKGSLQLTVYGPNDLGVTKLIQSLTVLDGTEEKALQLPLNADDTPAVTQLNGGTVTVTYHDVEMVNGLLRTKYTIDVTNVQGDITFNSVDCRKWVDKAVNVNELEGIAALEYCGPDGEWQSFDVNRLPNQVPFFTCDALDFIEGHYQVVNFRFKLQDGYENPQLELTKKNGTIDKGELKPDADGWYNFNITIGAKWTDDDILVWFGDDTYQVDMRLTAQPKTSYEAKFYIHEKGETAASDYTFVGIGSVAFGAPVWAYANDPIELNSSNLNKVTAPSKLTFPDIFVDGVKYVYSKGSTKAGTYDFKGWDVAKAAWTDDTETKLEWHVDGIIEVNSLPELSDDMKPEVVGTTVTYDGYAHGLNINYKKNYPKRYFKVTYEVWNEDTEAWDELPLGQVPAQTEAGRMDVRVTFEYRSTVDPHLPLTVETSIVVMPRPLDLTVQDVTILKGETPTFTVIPSAEGENTGLLTSLDHTLVNWKVNENYNKDVAGEYSITLDLSSLKIVDEAGNDVTKNYSFNLVPGTLTVKALLPADLQPTVGNTSSTYDGQAHGLYISYPDGTSASDYKVEYQIAGGAWSETAPSLTNVDKVENVKVRFTYGDYATYEAPSEYSVEVTKRALTLRVNDDKIEDGERIPAFSYTITSGSLVSGQSITGVTYGGYKDELGIYDVNILTYKIVAGATDVTGNYEVTLLPGVFTIGTAGGGGGTTPTPNPNPNPNPTPVPVPVEPETPVTPVAPVTPDEEEEEPAEVEDIEEEETPQASPDTDADKEEDKTENIEDEETAQAGAPGEGNWALLNLILMALTVVAGLAMLALRFARKTGMAHLLGIVPAIVALVAFFVTEDMSLPMAMTDKWTLIMALIAVVQVVLLVLGRNGAQEDDQPREQY